MSAYTPGFVKDLAIPFDADLLSISISPSALELKEPMVADGEVLFAGDPLDIVMDVSEVVVFTASASLLPPP
jgi:hypothetical protein